MAENAEAVSSEQDDVSFLRTDDIVCLSCTVQSARDAGTGSGDRVCLAAEGFGSRQCFLEIVSDPNQPPDLASCMLVIEQALSVRALQEMVNTADTGTQSGHRTLLYGHAVLLRHFNSAMYLTCLNTSSSSDKLAFDVGLRETAQGEACWWIIHPASKQRSEGEKVRVGDDLILVSVATERYLHTLKTDESTVIASFHQTLWTVLPIASGNVKSKYISFVFGQEVIRFFHGHDECMTVPENWSDHPQHNLNVVVYEGGDALTRARSLWRIELIRSRWNGGFINWKQKFRIQHITTGRYMCITENPAPEAGQSRWRVSLVPRSQAKLDDAAFVLKANKDEKDDKEKGDDKEKEDEGMGPSTIKYGDTVFIIQHWRTKMWLSYDTIEETKRGVGKVEEKHLALSEEGHMDDTLSFSRSQQEESKSGRVIRKCAYLFHKFNRGLDALQNQPMESRHRSDSFGQTSMPRFNLREMIDALKDLIGYFAQPEDGMEHEARQVQYRALRNRQDLFQQEGILSLVLDTIDKITALTTQGMLNSFQGEDGGWEEISSYLYLLIAAMIKGNHGNCAQFAQSARLNWLFSQLTQQGSEGVLEVLHCVLIDSPEALNMIREEHIRDIISLLDRSGRDHKVLDVLGSFCVGNGLAVRSSQNHICQHLLPGKDLLLQTRLVDHVSSMHPNIYVGYVEGSAIFKRWYFEAIVDHVEPVSGTMPHIRIGWANTDGYTPYPGGGERWGSNGVGDDMFSFGFDGINIWTGGHSRAVRMYDASVTSGFHKGDIVGCNLDLTLPEISFSLNGIRLRATIKNFNVTGMFFPVVSMSARSSARFMLGGEHGRLKHGPPSGYSAVIESLLPKETLKIEPCFYFGDIHRSMLAGPLLTNHNVGFVPNPVDTAAVILPNYIMQVRDRLAENMHELWAMNKIEAGWTFAEVRDDNAKRHPNLTSFKNLPVSEKNYDITLSVEMLKALLALGYHVSMIPTDNRIRQMKLSSTYTQPNGYKPTPLDLCNIQLSPKMEELVEILSENIHNVWAKTRIEQGWTYGLSKQPITKRSSHLVRYQDVDDAIKKINRDTATEAVRTLIAFGYSVEPPAGDAANKAKGHETVETKVATRSYRAEKTYAVTEGKWYYELDVMTSGYIKVGWARIDCPPGVELGTDEYSYAFDGFVGRKWHEGPETFGRPWQAGDVLGCLLDLHDKTISFTINGELLLGPGGNEAAFENVSAEAGGFVPAITLGSGERARFNFGQDIHSLKFFTACGLQEGYEPFCVNMTKPVPFWYDRDEAKFVPVTDTNSMLEVSRIPASASVPAAIKLTRKSQGLTDRLQMEFLRLSLPITCREQYISEEEKQRLQTEIEIAKRMQRQMPAPSMQPRISVGGPGTKIEEHMISGGFNANDIQNLTSQGQFMTEESVDTMDTDNAEEMPAPRNAMMQPRSSLSTEKYQRQRGIMKKTQSLEQDGAELNVPANAPNQYMQPPSKRMHRSSSENRLDPARDRNSFLVETRTKYHSPTRRHRSPDNSSLRESTGPDGKPKKRSQSPFSYITKKIKESKEKHRDKSKERQEPALSAKTPPSPKTMPRTPDITLAAGTAGGPMLTLRMPTPMPSFANSQDLMTPTPDIDVMAPRVAFGGLDNDQYRPISALSAGSEMNSANSTLFDLVSEFHYAVRIFPGQDPKCVYLGWVTSDFHHTSSPFSLDAVRRAEVRILDIGGQQRERCLFQNAFLVCAGELQEQAASQTGQEKSRAAPGLVIGTSIDIATGWLSFNLNGREIEGHHQIEPGTKLYPAVFVEPTSKEVLQFEFSATKSALPLSSALFHRDRSLVPQSPPRLRVLTLKANHWGRVPSQFLRVHELKMSDVRGWSMLCDDPVSILALYIPEEDRCIDILELIEHEDLLLFHAHTLMLYCAICSHGNHRVAHALVKHVDQKQLLFAIQNPYMSGALRRAFYDLLIALHLDTHAKTIWHTRNEFVIPVAKRESGNKRSGRGTPDLLKQQSVHDQACTSIRPTLNMKDKLSSEGEENAPIMEVTAPSFPLSMLKSYVMEALSDGVRKGTNHCRDPIGGSYENLFVPLLKIVDQLLLVGIVDQQDMNNLLVMIDPASFGGRLDNGQLDRGLLHIRLDEGVKLQLCYVLQDLCDERVRKRIEEIVYFSEEFVGKVQADQLRRYIEIKQSDLPSSVAAKKTKEFRCPPKEQMKMLLSFKHPEEEETASCPAPEPMREDLASYHGTLVDRLGPKPQERVTRYTRDLGYSNEVLTEAIKKSVISWAAESHIESQELIKEMFFLLHRQYDGVGETLQGVKKAYVISTASIADVTAMFASLGRVRTLLSVQMEKDEESVLRTSLWELMNNKVFFQHPDLIGMLCVHENVMTVMMNTIGKSQNADADRQTGQPDGQKDAAEMVVACCKFLCYFCRTSRTNQKAMFEHLGYLLDNSSMLLYRPSLRGSAPLDVAYFSLMDNSELALSLRESHLEKIATYLSRCGLQSNSELLAKGYPDIGWDPVEGERYLDFLRFCVWVNGESVEENANLVVRLLIRRPECLGPALRGGGTGLLQAMKGAIALSDSMAGSMDPALKEDEDYIDMGEAILNFYSVLVDLLGRCAPDVSQLAHARSDSVRARAILQSLVPLADLEGVLSLKFFIPNFSAIEAITNNEMPEVPPAILPNHKQAVLVFLERVYGVEESDTFFRLLEESFLPDLRAGTMMDGGLASESDISLALNRYLCNSVLPLLTKQSRFFATATAYSSLLDATLHTAYTLSKVKNLTKNQREVISEFLLALIREIDPAMMERLLRKLIVDVSALSEHTIVALKLLTSHYERCNKYYGSTGGFGTYGTASEAEKRLTMMLFSRIFDSLAGRSYDPELFNYALPCLSAIGSALPPDYALVKTADDEVDASKVRTDGRVGYQPSPVETSTLFLQPDLQNMAVKFAEHYHDAWALKHYEAGWGYHPTRSEEEKVHPFMQPYSYLPPDAKEDYRLPAEQAIFTILALGWTVERGEEDSRGARTQLMKRRPSRGLQPGHGAGTNERRSRRKAESNILLSSLPKNVQPMQKQTWDELDLPYGYVPRPVELNNLTLNREMQALAECLAQNAHDLWAQNVKADLTANPEKGILPEFVPFDLLTDREKKTMRERAQELLKFLLYSGYRLKKERPANARNAAGRGSVHPPSEIESRFAYSLLEKLLHYCDVTSAKMRNLNASSTFTRRNSYKEAAGDVKFFGKVVLPLVEQYFRSQKSYFLLSPNALDTSVRTASPKEKEMVASLFCRLAMLLRTKVTSFGHDTQIALQCLQVLVQTVDASSLVKNSLDFVRTSFLTFFNQAAADLANTVTYLKTQYYPAARGTTPKQSTSMGYVEGVLLRVLISLFDHIGANNFGRDILVNDIQIACYSILDSLYTLGTNLTLPANIKLFEEISFANRPLIGACLAAFASTFPVAFLEPEFDVNNPFCILGRAQEQSIQAQEIMNRLSASLPQMEALVQEVETFTQSGDYAVSPHIIDVILPMLCSYLSTWYFRGPETAHPDDTTVTKVTSDHLNQILTQSLTLIRNNIGDSKATWMVRIAAVVGQIVINSSPSLLNDRILPIAIKLRENTKSAHANEEVLRHGQRLGDDLSSVEASVGEEYAVLVRDLYAFDPIAIRYAEIHKAQWIRENNSQAEQLYAEVSEVFNHWMRSQHFKREELNFLSGNDVDVNALISAGARGICRIMSQSGTVSGAKTKKKKRDRSKKDDSATQQSLIVVCLKRFLPVGLNLFLGREQELVQKVKEKMLRNEPNDLIEEYVNAELMLPDQPDPSDKKAWQRKLYIKIGKKQLAKPDDLVEEESSTAVVQRILAMSKVLHGLHLVDHPPGNSNDTWRRLVSSQRKKAIISCFRMVALHSLPRHRAINLFVHAYRDLWLSDENVGQELMIANLTEPIAHDPSKALQLATPHPDTEEPVKTDQLEQIVTAFSRAATTEHSNDQFVELYLRYADIMSKSCGGTGEEEEEEEGGEEAGPSMQEQELERQKLLAEQGRLADRGVAEMVLMYISASTGEPSDTVWATLTLGISVLRGGNTGVQKRMATQLKEKRDVGFFNSMAGLMNAASVLNLDAFERIMKAEGLGVSSADASPTEANNEDAEKTCKIFRFLQLLCEGHNLEFQDYLRSQQGNTATVNLVICTVDYLLRLQESVMDFYWHYSSKEFVDPAGIVEFQRAMKIAGQVFNSLTEFIQGPCSGNQLTLANSRLWDAIGGFLFLFAHMQDKLAKAKEASQLDLLQGFLDLQNDMMTMLISMLEGNTLNGTIGKQMVDSLSESSQNVETIIKFFDIFLKLEELVNSASFQEYDPGHTGWITTHDLKKAMESQKIYDAEQVAYLMSCVSSLDGRVDYIEFTERYNGPARDIGFNVAVLLTNLSEHITHDSRLQRILDVAGSMLKAFEPNLGRIEIIGNARRIERVYFEIPEQNRQQWEKPQIKESKKAFLHAVVNDPGDKGKLEMFVDFCEDAIFEMQHAASISVKEEPPMKVAKPLTLDVVEVPSTWEATKKVTGKLGSAVKSIVGAMTPGNVKRKVARWKKMTYPQLAMASVKGFFWMIYYIIYFQIFVIGTTGRFLLYMMTGYTRSDAADKPIPEPASTTSAKPPDLNPRSIYGLTNAFTDSTSTPVSAFGISMLSPNAPSHDDSDKNSIQNFEMVHATHQPNGHIPEEREEHIIAGRKPDALVTIREETSEIVAQNVDLAKTSPNLHHAVAGMDENTGEATRLLQAREEERKEEEEGAGSKSNVFASVTLMLNSFARNYYNLQIIGLILAFSINAILLSYKVTDATGGLTFNTRGHSGDVANADTEVEEMGDDEARNEIITIDETWYYLRHVIGLLAASHTLVAFLLLVAYYHLKVPLAIFKREKQIARKLEFEGIWIVEPPDDYASKWDSLVISTETFPENYWDKFVKKKVLAKYKETHDIGMIMRTLGLKVATDSSSESTQAEGAQKGFWLTRWIPTFGVDWKYRIWKWGVIFSDMSFLYHLGYLIFSVIGNYNYFFFAAHLVDVAKSSKQLGTILQSVTQNGRQLLLTVMFLTIVVYLYTVVAFNFFRKFYVQEGEDGGEQPDMKCHDMATCFIFHLYAGVRNGGGVGDAIQEPDGDPLEYYRIIFDITFFFFIIVILLAIVQGLIIDAFGDLRSQLDQVTEDMESKCFICEIGKDYFDKVPHGFEQHTMKEHNFASYMFFLMHLINKDQTEHTGQETYVWQMYQQRCWDFFPVGDCFRKQYESELGAG